MHMTSSLIKSTQTHTQTNTHRHTHTKTHTHRHRHIDTHTDTLPTPPHLFDVVFSREQRLPAVQLRENAPHTPHVDFMVILGARAHDLRCPVPARDDVFGELVIFLQRGAARETCGVVRVHMGIYV
jgi:hypothetical protein